QRRRLPGAVRPHQRDDLAGVDVERHAEQHPQPAVAGVDGLDVQQGHLGTPRNDSITRGSRVTSAGGPSAISSPDSRQYTYWQTRAMTGTWCSMTTSVSPSSSRRPRNDSASVWDSAGPRPAVASSSSSRSGPAATAAAIS